MQLEKPFVNEPVTILDYGFGKSAKKGTPLIWFKFELTGQPMLSDGSFETIRGDLYLTVKTLKRVTETLRLLGFKGDVLKELDPTQPGHHDFKGVQTHISTKIEEYNGKISHKVDSIGFRETRLSDQELDEISQRFQAEIMFNKQTGVV